MTTKKRKLGPADQLAQAVMTAMPFLVIMVVILITLALCTPAHAAETLTLEQLQEMAKAKGVDATTPVIVVAPAPQPVPPVVLELRRWYKGGFGSIMLADFTIVNNTRFAVKDFEVTCYGYANSGTKIDRNVRTIYERVAASSVRRVNEFNMGFVLSQANQTKCELTNYKQVD